MYISSQRYGFQYFAGWFCTCEKCCGIGSEPYETEEEAMNAGERQLIHLYKIHPEVKSEI